MNKAKETVLALLIVFFALAATGVLWFLLQYGPAFGIYLRRPDPEEYLRTAVSFMDNGIYADSEEWKLMKAETLTKARETKSYEQADVLIHEAARVAGGKHSKLMSAEAGKAAENDFLLPETDIDENGILYLRLPAFMGTAEQGKKYADTAIAFLREHQDAVGVILDLRGNTGGDMGAMVAAVSPLLADGELMRFSTAGMETPVTLRGSCCTGGGRGVETESFKMPGEIPVAILTDEMTASSGEALLICFRGVESACSFGSPTAGYASSNTVYKLYGGARLLLTIGRDVSRTGEVFCEDPIPPDVETEDPLREATLWICAR